MTPSATSLLTCSLMVISIRRHAPVYSIVPLTRPSRPRRMICSAYAPPLGFRPRTFRPYWCVPIGRCRYGVVRHAAQHRSDHLDGSGGSGNELVAFGGLVKRDPDRHTLSQPHPVERRIDVGKQG